VSDSAATREGLPPFIVLIDGRDGEPVSFWPHYTSTYCQHGAHDACRLVCKTCEAPCRCACHKEALGAESVGYMFSGGKYHIRRGETVEVPTEEARGLALGLRAYGGAEWPGLRCWPKAGDPDTTVVSWTDEPGAET
jgi:hypothetical protein